MSHTETGIKRPWLMAVATYIFGAVVYSATTGIEYWVAGKPIHVPGTIFKAIFFSWIIIHLALQLKRQQKNPTLPEPIGTRLKEALRSEGLDKVCLRYTDQGSLATFPRPRSTGGATILSERVIREYSPEALIWSVKTDTLAATWATGRCILVISLAFFPILVLVGLCERFKKAWPFILALAGLVVLVIVVLWAIEFRSQVAADRKCTVTEADRMAAKEALSYPYFAQRDRPAYDKWLFFQSELRGRAKRLGIELERGFRVSNVIDD